MSDAAIRAAYERDGFLVERALLAPAALDPVRAFLAAEVEEEWQAATLRLRDEAAAR